ncbi:MAG: restriction endonuclease subunit M [Candidatus Eisenbacteria bacterium]|nr:restriction endonuclease subunit M [Candidatus Eisenbacteria bacterium]
MALKQSSKKVSAKATSKRAPSAEVPADFGALYSGKSSASGGAIAEAIKSKSPEQALVVAPLVEFLVERGWGLGQLRFGKSEWRVPKSPSEATKREKGRSFEGFPCDIAVFESSSKVNLPPHLHIIIECKQPDEEEGVAQLESYLALEPHVRLGIWANSAEPAAPAVFIYRHQGKFIHRRRVVADIPAPGEPIKADALRLTFTDMPSPSGEVLQRILRRMTDVIVARDANVTRREDQLNQLCNVLLIKLESDKKARTNPAQPVDFRAMATAEQTAKHLKDRFVSLTKLYPDVFTDPRDQQLTLADDTLYHCAENLERLKLLDLGAQTIALGFQVLRTEALKGGEGQYFTPQPVVHAGIRLLQITWDDIVIDPACGTGAFLVEVMLELGRSLHMGPELSRWAQKHIHGIDKDAVAVKLAKAVMQILGDGSANCVRGDSVNTHQWATKYPHLLGANFKDGRFSVVVTNPPFGINLTVSATDAQQAELELAKARTGEFEDIEIGLAFLERAYRLLRVGGRIGIILPETYFFSPSYTYVTTWMLGKLVPRVAVNVPMEAFAGFCRAKTNFYILEKVR